MMSRITLVLFAALSLALGGCVTHIKEDATYNPAPAERFSNFNHFELQPLALPPPFAGQAPNERARTKVQENIAARLATTIAAWNTAARDAQPVRTLVLEPSVAEIKFISVGSRIMAGAIPGSSAIILKVRISEKETGRVIATPEFYARGNTWAGAFSFGATDNVMLTRVANRFADYVLANYAVAVGGPTGAPAPGK